MSLTSVPSTITRFSMPPEVTKQNREVVLSEEIGRARMLTLNRPNHLNYISGKVAWMLGQYFEKYEKDDNAEFVILKGAGRTFSAGGDLEFLYHGRNTRDYCLDAVYRVYWLCYHIHTYKKPHIALVHGMSVGGGASLMVPMKFSVVTEKAWGSWDEARWGWGVGTGLGRVGGAVNGLGWAGDVATGLGGVGEWLDWGRGGILGLNRSDTKGKEIVAAGLATHFVPSQVTQFLYIFRFFRNSL
ncbi:putative 3-hydroxyisobutyryl-CoA hydrolase-like protein 5-like [Capsicum annuum]|nr:putative 3-hydroxyisobutyryl-CoA hydrolase-like protein 5-like [Capsicum annuum]KAF3656327.1 putative 3-hydroxyisobutyryl-CoA hydrolase-like protein 5-like [Capsicum annuum]